MKFALIALGFIAAGVVGGVTSDQLRVKTPHVPADSGRERLEAELSDLRNLVDRQGDEIRTLRDAAIVANEPTRLPAAPALETTDVPAEAELENRVAKIIEKKDQEEREARTQRFAAMAEERETARLKKVQENLGLTDYQAEELAKVWTERRTAMLAMREKLMEGGRENATAEQWTELREGMQKLRTDSEEKIKSLLTTDQYESYQKQNTGGRGPGVGFGGGRGGGR